MSRLLTRQHKLKVVIVAAMVSELLRRAAVRAGKERRFLYFARALVRQRETRFHKLVELVETKNVPDKWITDDGYLDLEGFEALDGSTSDSEVLAAAWSCIQEGLVNVLCRCEEIEKNWKPVVAEFSITDEKGKVKTMHKRLMKETQKIPEVMEMFRGDLKQLKIGLKEVKSLDKMPDEDELVSQLMLRLTPWWREFSEGKLRSKKATVEV